MQSLAGRMLSAVERKREVFMGVFERSVTTGTGLAMQHVPGLRRSGEPAQSSSIVIHQLLCAGVVALMP